MGRSRALLFFVFLLWTCCIGACRTTQSQLYSPSYIPTGPYTSIAPEVETPVRPDSAGSKIPLLLLTAVILIGLIMVFASDKKPKKKKVSTSSRPRRLTKRAKKAEQ
jgi:hypothetical protein